MQRVPKQLRGLEVTCSLSQMPKPHAFWVARLWALDDLHSALQDNAASAAMTFSEKAGFKVRGDSDHDTNSMMAPNLGADKGIQCAQVETPMISGLEICLQRTHGRAFSFFRHWSGSNRSTDLQT